MHLTRREFAILAAGAACTSCGLSGGGSEPLARRTVDAGPIEQFDADGTYDHFRHAGFFLVRKEGALHAISSDCTHRDCPLRAMPDHTFACKCHGSRFDDAGHVLKGPAVRDLPQFPWRVDEHQHLLVEVARVKFDEE